MFRAYLLVGLFFSGVCIFEVALHVGATRNTPSGKLTRSKLVYKDPVNGKYNGLLVTYVLPAFLCGMSFTYAKELSFIRVIPLLLIVVTGLCVLQLFSEWCLPELSLIRWSPTAKKYVIIQFLYRFFGHFRVFFLGFAFWIAARLEKMRNTENLSVDQSS